MRYPWSLPRRQCPEKLCEWNTRKRTKNSAEPTLLAILRWNKSRSVWIISWMTVEIQKVWRSAVLSLLSNIIRRQMRNVCMWRKKGFILWTKIDANHKHMPKLSGYLLKRAISPTLWYIWNNLTQFWRKYWSSLNNQAHGYTQAVYRCILSLMMGIIPVTHFSSSYRLSVAFVTIKVPSASQIVFIHLPLDCLKSSYFLLLPFLF